MYRQNDRNSTVAIEVLELVQNVLEQPEFAPQLIALMDSDLQPAMTAIAQAVDANNQTAATIALAELSAILES